jgi:hypothetical protein
MKIGQLSFISDFSVTSWEDILNCTEILIEHRTIKPLSISLYFKIEIRCQICNILRELRRPCSGYTFRNKIGKVISNAKYGAFFRSAINSGLASLLINNSAWRIIIWWPSAYTSVIYVAVTICILKNAVGLSIVDIVISAQRSPVYYHPNEIRNS